MQTCKASLHYKSAYQSPLFEKRGLGGLEKLALLIPPLVG